MALDDPEARNELQLPLAVHDMQWSGVRRPSENVRVGLEKDRHRAMRVVAQSLDPRFALIGWKVADDAGVPLAQLAAGCSRGGTTGRHPLSGTGRHGGADAASAHVVLWTRVDRPRPGEGRGSSGRVRGYSCEGKGERHARCPLLHPARAGATACCRGGNHVNPEVGSAKGHQGVPGGERGREQPLPHCSPKEQNVRATEVLSGTRRVYRRIRDACPGISACPWMMHRPCDRLRVLELPCGTPGAVTTGSCWRPGRGGRVGTASRRNVEVAERCIRLGDALRLASSTMIGQDQLEKPT